MDGLSPLSSASRPMAPGFGGASVSSSGGFSASLEAALSGRRSSAAPDAREAAEELVAITLVQPILAELRESDMGAEPFKATDTEKKFGALYDAEIARRIVKKAGFPLVDALARQMREREASKEFADAHTRQPIDHFA